MEYLVVLVVVAAAGYYFWSKKKQETVTQSDAPASEPVKEPTKEPVKCGCGRSPTGNCVGLHALTQEEWATHPDNPVKPVVEAKPAKTKKPAAKKAKTTAEKAPAKNTPKLKRSK